MIITATSNLYAKTIFLKTVIDTKEIGYLNNPPPISELDFIIL